VRPLVLTLVLMRMISVRSQTMFLLRCMILMRLLQGGLLGMSWLLCQLVLMWLTTYPPTPFIHSMLERNETDCMDFLGTFKGYEPSLDPYSLYLENMLAKILFTTAFYHSTDFSKACDKFKRELIIISQFIFKCFYLHPYELRPQV